VGVFGCSQYIFACVSKSLKVEDFIDSHNQMFQFFGGVPEVLVPDNLKSAVITGGEIPSSHH
jgi:transposase